MIFLLPSRASALKPESFPMSAFTTAKSTGGFGKFGFPVILVTTAVPRVTTSRPTHRKNHPMAGLLSLSSSTYTLLFVSFVIGFGGEPLPAAKRKRDSLQPQETAGGF